MKIEQRILEIRRAEDNAWHKPRVGVYHASAIYDIVTGALTPKKFFKTSKFDDITLFTFEIGKMYHNHIQSFFPKEAREQKIKIKIDDFIVVGSVDLTLPTPCELKTCSELPRKHYKAHEYQLQTYLEGLDYDYGYLTYIEKNPRTIVSKNFKITRDKKMWAEIVTKLRQFHSDLKVEQDKLIKK